ncbi:hypothetical protein BN110_016 [Yersinia phage phiR8-01]|uniref:Uncharacterized protein n=1 Tax=Yersinia phage phiR8-01 TaxID=1206556 RepID=I7K2H3_9CAUD|nr:hypothetical protein HOT05_gp05 [Yersinia phage phiR8-01]CCI88386.2 hypothetical protein BN110_016 [Yersinia phage phiR8-01]
MPVIIWLICFAAWLTAVIGDAVSSNIAWVLVDIFLSPVGVVRGLLMWVGVV